MKIKNKLVLLLILNGICQTFFGQQDAMFTHYMYNTIAVNPAYAGSRDALTINALHRSQWVDFEGAPVTQTITMHSPVFNNKLGLGLSILNDVIGPVKSTAAYIDFAYILKTGERSKLAFGLSGGINSMQIGLSNLKLDQQSDVSFQENVQSKLLPNFGFGLYFYQPKFYLGISSPKLLENNYKTNTTSGTTNLSIEQRHYFVIAGAICNLSNSIKLKPTFLIKTTIGAPVEADITAAFVFYEKLSLAAMYRTNDAIGALIGYNVTNQFHLGYSFDWSYGMKTFKYNKGSHEIMLSYDFIFKDKQKIRSPRYF